MSVQETDDPEILRAAYSQAWAQFVRVPGLDSDERADAQRKLRQYIEMLVSAGERDADKIALSALGLVREQVQLIRSRASIDLRGVFQD